MITFILKKLYYFLAFIIGLFPTGKGFSTEVHNAFITLGGYMHTLDAMIPFETLFICLGLVFTVEIALFGFKTVKWLISHIPFIGGRG